MSEVCGAEQHCVSDMKFWAPNDIADGKRLICNWRGRCKKEEVEPVQDPKGFNLKKLGAPLLQIFDVDDREYVHVVAVFYHSCPFEEHATDLISRILIRL